MHDRHPRPRLETTQTFPPVALVLQDHTTPTPTPTLANMAGLPATPPLTSQLASTTAQQVPDHSATMKLTALAATMLVAAAGVASVSADDYQPALRALAAPEPAAPNAAVATAAKETTGDAKANANGKKEWGWGPGFGFGGPWGGWGGYGGLGGWGWGW